MEAGDATHPVVLYGGRSSVGLCSLPGDHTQRWQPPTVGRRRRSSTRMWMRRFAADGLAPVILLVTRREMVQPSPSRQEGRWLRPRGGVTNYSNNRNRHETQHDDPPADCPVSSPRPSAEATRHLSNATTMIARGRTLIIRLLPPGPHQQPRFPSRPPMISGARTSLARAVSGV